jgi:hypothetical protein
MLIGSMPKRKLSISIFIENPPGIGASALKLAVRMAAGWEFADGVLKEGTDGNQVIITLRPTSLLRTHSPSRLKIRQIWLTRIRFLHIDRGSS